MSSGRDEHWLRSSAPDKRWTIAGILVAGVIAYVVLGGASPDAGCGDSPPYLDADARLCFLVGYDGPIDNQALLPLLDLRLDEVEALADDEGWTVYVKRRDDGLDPDVVDDEVRPDRIGVELDGDVVVRIWPG